MTSSLKTTPEKKQLGEDRSIPRSRWAWLWPTVQLIVALLITSGALVFLWSPFKSPTTSTATVEAAKNADAVQLVGPGLLQVKKGTPLDNKLVVVPVGSENISSPVLTVTGSIVARLRPEAGPAEDRWQFSTPELLSAYTDWRKSNADVDFAERQLAKIRELNTTRVTRQKDVVERLKKLVAAGTDSKKDLAAEETNLLLAEIQGQKEVYEAETAVRVATRSRAALARQLFQAGTDPHLLGLASEGTAVVVADVPEARLGLVRERQACEARFYGFPGSVFTGRVSSLAPTLSKERRTLRVLFEVNDPQDRLKPGMFAEVGLGTDARATLMAPADGVLHVGRSDYMLVGTEPNTWRVTEVNVGELHGIRVEILEGLREGDRVVGSGAILLKPFVVQAAQGAFRLVPDNATPTPEKSGS